MATRSYTRHTEGDGWMGIRFQHAPRAEPSEIILHVRMLDTENLREQEAIGFLGVNLIHGAFFLREDPPTLISSLLDGLTQDRIEVDMIRFRGPVFAGVDNRLMALQLVQQNFTEATMFTATGEVIQPAELLYKKPILIERGSFAPITNLTLAILESARARFQSDEPPVVLMEMTLRQLQTGDKIELPDFLARADTLAALGHTVMISNYLRYHRLVPFLRRQTPKRIGFAMGLRNVRELNDQQFYTDMPAASCRRWANCSKATSSSTSAHAPKPASPPARKITKFRHISASLRALVENQLLEPFRLTRHCSPFIRARSSRRYSPVMRLGETRPRAQWCK